MQLDMNEVYRIISTALEEDLGKGDITSRSVIPEDAQMRFAFVAREDMVVAGLPVAQTVLEEIDLSIISEILCEEGQQVKAGTQLITGEGNARSVLAAERVALNLIQRMCGIATLTRRYVDAIEGTNTRLLDTRKTTPGLREIEKYAVRMGGGYNHRFRLDDGVLIKDNHIAVCGSITQAATQARANTPILTRVEVECDTIEQVKEALAAGADMIMLDNMGISTLHEAVNLVAGRITLEASGGVSLETIRDIASTGVDYISVGKLTHSAPSIDIGLDVVYL